MLKTVTSDVVFKKFNSMVRVGLADLGEGICGESTDLISGKLETTFRDRLNHLAEEQIVLTEEQLPLVEEMARSAIDQAKRSEPLKQAAKAYSAAIKRMETHGAILDESIDHQLVEATRKLEHYIDDVANKSDRGWASSLEKQLMNIVPKERLDAAVGKIRNATQQQTENLHNSSAEWRKPNVFASIENVGLGIKHVVTGQALSHGWQGKAATGAFAAGVGAVGHGIYRMGKTQINDDTGKPYHDVKGGGIEMGGGVALLLAALKMAEKNVRGL